jgi:hypothetical protein
MKLYSATDYKTIPWPKNSLGDATRNYFGPMLKKETKWYFENISSEVYILIFNDKVLPVNLGSSNHGDSYVTSPYCHFILYLLEEVKSLKNVGLSLFCNLIILPFSLVAKACQINEVVYINNWFLSTNLYPDLTANEIEEMTTFIQMKFPRQAIIFRSLNTFANQDLIDMCEAQNYKKIISRQVYIIDDFDRCLKHRDFHNDTKLWETSEYELLDPDINDVEQLHALYNQLYLEKYSYFNPQFNQAFLKQALETKNLNVLALKKDDRIQACLGYFTRQKQMTTPLLGYNTALPQKDGLYRILSLLLIHEAKEKSMNLNCSAGAAGFKEHRGAMPYFEYMLINTSKCSFRKIPWLIVQFIFNPIATYLFKKLKL